jgi:N-acetylmuramic acid 6-phosphate etherase
MEMETEKESKYQDLDKMSIKDILLGINKEDSSISIAVKKVIPNIEALARVLAVKLQNGGRLFYIGAGTSGRLGVLDASECPPTFGVSHELIVGIIAGGDNAIRKAVEFAEDDMQQAWKDLLKFNITEKDVVVGIAASGSTPYVIGGLREANINNLVTGCIVCNSESPVASEAKYPIEVIVGPEFISGSTRMKSGTAQKMVLNMLSTSVMIKLGKVKGNKMVDMQLTNNKLFARGVKMIMTEIGIDESEAISTLQEYGSVRKSIESYQKVIQKS